ncbi:MAG: citrate:proton symporter [Deferribacteraceae bacterium]|jgi:CitMHS family citrate-Mg2+:H+ or citrate-Ca2+:H+ symporter|nr:citrate:proton symporter [Deferribacteraceae bacterium]
MLALMGFALIIVFMILLSMKKLSPFVGLIVVASLFGLVAAFVFNDAGVVGSFKSVFQWIREGVFYQFDQAGNKVVAGTVNTAALLLFAIIYFSLMLNAGMFDPLCIGLLKSVKGDPLKITVVTALLSSVVALDGDGTTTVLIVTAAVLTLYKKMNMKMTYLAMLIVIPNSILNFMPWGGPLARVLSVVNLEVTELFPLLMPGVAAAMVYVFVIAYVMGMSERKRLGYVKGGKEVISALEIEAIIDEMRNRDLELKRPKLFYVNVTLSLLIMLALITGVGNGAILFMVGTAVALMINYPKLKDQAARLRDNGGDAMGPVVVIFAAGALMGILNGSGMSTAIADNMIKWIPESWGGHIPFLSAFVALPGLIFLSNDAYYFGILPVISPIAYGFGATPIQMGAAAMIGQALHFASPLVAFIYILIDRCEISFGEYAKEFVKWAWPIFFIYLGMAVLTGLLPISV